MKPGQTLNVVAIGVGKSIFWSERVNERIQALASEAEDYAEGIISQLDTVRGGEFHEAYTKKFAELIVRECANVLRAESERLYKLSAEEKDELFASNFEICAEKCVDNEVAIREHFGVEE
jgi:hypothetical protein